MDMVDLFSLDSLPILGVCGCSGSGKTTLIESLIPQLLRHDVRVVVVKHDARGVLVDYPGKDSDRFFKAGADVWLDGEDNFYRTHTAPHLSNLLIGLAAHYDLVLVEGHLRTEAPKIWLEGGDCSKLPQMDEKILKVFRSEQREIHIVLPWVIEWLQAKIKKQPVFGCVLIGGRSSRMGRPKHLLQQGAKTWLEQSVTMLCQVVDQVVISGKGEVPDSLSDVPRIPDSMGLAGPLAGILSIMRWQPRASWIVVGCDQPNISPEAVQWLLQSRSAATCAILPTLDGNRLEPLLAYYDRKCLHHLEELAVGGTLRLSELRGKKGIESPRVPEQLQPCWQNINTPEELQAI